MMFLPISSGDLDVKDGADMGEKSCIYFSIDIANHRSA